tara:strand:- start:1121 stop:1513 length:393 start_codon:yes stop_codon:yes gene_type:complete
MAGKGGARPGAGRPPKSTVEKSTIDKSSIDKLKKLGIDPINILVKELSKLKGKDDFRSQNLRVRIAEKLLEYGYQKQPVGQASFHQANVPILTIVQKSTEPQVKPVEQIIELTNSEAVNNQAQSNDDETQ